MDKNFGQNNQQVVEWAYKTFNPEDALLKSIRELAKEAGLPPIQVGAFDALHLEVLTRAMGAKKIVEIGTLGGYSATCLARALPADGCIYTFELSEQHAQVAEKALALAGVADKVKIFVGPALENLARIEHLGPFDLVFLDADKLNYVHYFNWAAQHLRVGGSVLADNTFAFGEIHKTEFTSKRDLDTIGGLQKFNQLIAQHPQFRATILPTGEGLTLGVKIK